MHDSIGPVDVTKKPWPLNTVKIHSIQSIAISVKLLVYYIYKNLLDGNVLVHEVYMDDFIQRWTARHDGNISENSVQCVYRKGDLCLPRAHTKHHCGLERPVG